MINDMYSEERQRRVWNQQASFARNCFFLALGFMALGVILTCHFCNH